MFKRLFWFTLGVVAGIFGIRYVKEKAQNAADDFRVTDLAADVFGMIVKLVKYVIDLIGEVVAKNDQASPPRN